ncbi:MAG: HupE/UreJ family protein [Vicinamibacterales bacterium]
MPRSRTAVAAFLFVLSLACASRADAHPSPFSYIDLDLRADGVYGTLVAHVLDVAHDAGVTPSERLLDPLFLAQRATQIQALLGGRLRVQVAGVSDPQWTSIEAVPDQQAIRLKFVYHVPAAGSVTAQPRMFPYDPLHQSFVNVFENGALKQQFVFAGDSPARTFYAGTTQGVLAVMATFIPSGVEHILIGPDHILFLVGLLLLGGGWKALVRIVTAFTIGHSITLSLAALNYVLPPPQLIEPAIALSIVFVGADNLVRGGGRDVRAWIALVFGLVHGFGFANVLREFGLPTEALGWSLFSFNVGVELGQLAIVLVVASLLAAIRRRDATLGARVAFAGSIVVIAAGSYWFVQRVFFPA